MKILAKVSSDITDPFLPGQGEVTRNLHLTTGSELALEDVDSTTVHIWDAVKAIAWECAAKAPGEKVFMEINLSCTETNYSESLRLEFMYDDLNDFNIDLHISFLERKDTLRSCLMAQIIKHLMSSK